MDIEEAPKIMDHCKSTGKSGIVDYCDTCKFKRKGRCIYLVRMLTTYGYNNNFPLEFETPEAFVKQRIKSKLDQI